MKAYILERLKEPSTWRGIVLLLTAAGVPMAPGVADLVVAVGLAVAGMIGTVMPDKAR